MNSPFGIDDGVPVPTPAKRGRPKERDVAHKAANSIRNGQFKHVEDAAAHFFEEYLQRRPIANATDPDARRDRFKAFIRYIAEDIKANPKRLGTFAALERRGAKRREQPAIKAKMLKVFSDAIEPSQE